MNYLPVLFISYLGVVAGSIIASFTKEELAPGIRYFLILKALSFSAVVFFYLSYLDIFWIFSLLVSLAVLGIAYYWTRRLPHFDLFAYAFYAIAAYEMQNYLPHVAIIIFFFGIASSSVLHNAERSVFWNILHRISDNSIYIFAGLGLYLLNL
jgi:hypothetical protein